MEAEAIANGLQAQEKQKLSYPVAWQCGERTPNRAGHHTLWRTDNSPIPQAVNTRDRTTTVPVPEATVTKLRAEQAAATTARTSNIQPVFKGEPYRH